MHCIWYKRFCVCYYKIMLMFLNNRDFSINRGRLQISSRDNLIILSIFSKTCKACNYARNNLVTITDLFPTVSFAIVNLDTQPQIIELMKEINMPITHTPCYMLFKFGVYSRHLDLGMLEKSLIQNALKFELDKKNILPKTDGDSNYTNISEI
ncbi:thioredoxin-like protein [Dasineura jujubifolia toursvirus 2a]|nr:thioredoxin-like protein [Dasineura jujubifolia toursvirus 2a]